MESDQQLGQVETATHPPKKKCATAANGRRFVLFRHGGKTLGQLFLLLHFSVIEICLFISLWTKCICPSQNFNLAPLTSFSSQLCFSICATFGKQSAFGTYSLTVWGRRVSRSSKVPRYSFLQGLFNRTYVTFLCIWCLKSQ